MRKSLKLGALSAILGMGMILGACGGKEEAASPTPGDDTGKTEATESIGEQVDYKIIGIDPGAGLMNKTAEVIKEYQLDNWELVEGSSAAMTAALKKAYDKKEPIIVTGWTPHWMFAKFDLKYLDDPKGVYGKDEEIHTIARNGLKEEDPNAYSVLEKFEWTPDDMAEVMVAIYDGKEPEEAAKEWVEKHADKVSTWTDGAEKVDGKNLVLAYVAWDSEIASTNVLAEALKGLGYKVEMLQVEAGAVWSGIAGGSADASVAAWLPTTHEDYAKQFEGKYEDLGTNLVGTKLGLVVPSYVEINSIEDMLK